MDLGDDLLFGDSLSQWAVLQACLLLVLRFPLTGSSLRQFVTSLRSLVLPMTAAARGHRLIVARGGRGFLAWEMSGPRQRTLAYLASARTGHGTGSRLLEAFLRDADAHGHAVQLDCERSLVAFYANHGFRPIPGTGVMVHMDRRRRR